MMEYDGSFEPITTMKANVSFSIKVEVVGDVHV